METTDGKMNWKNRFYHVFLIIMLLLIFSVSTFMLVKVYQHIEKFENDPLVYGAIAHNISSCSCNFGDNDFLKFDQEGIYYTVKKKDTVAFNVNFSEYGSS